MFFRCAAPRFFRILFPARSAGNRFRVFSGAQRRRFFVGYFPARSAGKLSKGFFRRAAPGNFLRVCPFPKSGFQTLKMKDPARSAGKFWVLDPQNAMDFQDPGCTGRPGNLLLKNVDKKKTPKTSINFPAGAVKSVPKNIYKKLLGRLRRQPVFFFYGLLLYVSHGSDTPRKFFGGYLRRFCKDFSGAKRRKSFRI